MRFEVKFCISDQSSNLKIKNVFMLATRETVTRKINSDVPIPNVEANILNYVTVTC